MNCDFFNLSPKTKCLETFRNNIGFVVVSECLIDTSTHLKAHNIHPHPGIKIPLEYELILMRVGYLPDNEKFKSLKICASHRTKLGLGFYASKSCQHVNHLNISKSCVGFRYLNCTQAISLLNLKNKEPWIHLVKVGDCLCRKCYTLTCDQLKTAPYL